VPLRKRVNQKGKSISRRFVSASWEKEDYGGRQYGLGGGSCSQWPSAGVVWGKRIKNEVGVLFRFGNKGEKGKNKVSKGGGVLSTQRP